MRAGANGLGFAVVGHCGGDVRWVMEVEIMRGGLCSVAWYGYVVGGLKLANEFVRTVVGSRTLERKGREDAREWLAMWQPALTGLG